MVRIGKLNKVMKRIWVDIKAINVYTGKNMYENTKFVNKVGCLRVLRKSVCGFWYYRKNWFSGH